jgi:hypothetical protein
MISTAKFFCKFFCAAVAIMLCSFVAFSQTAKPGTGKPAGSRAPSASWVRSSPAYIELTLHKADIDAELLDLAVDYTDEYPKVKRLKLEAQFVQADLENMLKLDAAALPKLTESFAKLMLKKVAMQVDLAELKVDHKDDYPDVQRAQKRVQIYEKAIRDLLQ